MANEPSQKENAKPLPAGNENFLTQKDLKSLREFAREVSYPAGKTIVSRGDLGSAFYLIKTGQLEVILGQGDYRLPLARLEMGASFGEMS
ncbi:MAG: cyclic nucleotide-binding domain-containing protein, partial [Planctomycetota bacterium]